MLQDIEKGNHDDKKCEEYCEQYERKFGQKPEYWSAALRSGAPRGRSAGRSATPIFQQKLPNCQFKGNKSKIQGLIRKVHIDSDGSVTEVQFVKKTSQGTKSLQTKMKNFFRRK